jgi:hypothetical protein
MTCAIVLLSNSGRLRRLAVRSHKEENRTLRRLHIADERAFVYVDNHPDADSTSLDDHLAKVAAFFADGQWCLWQRRSSRLQPAVTPVPGGAATVPRVRGLKRVNLDVRRATRPGGGQSATCTSQPTPTKPTLTTREQSLDTSRPHLSG